MTESELALAEQKSNDYSVIINRLKQELSDSSTVHQSDIRREREVCLFVFVHMFVLVCFFNWLLIYLFSCHWILDKKLEDTGYFQLNSHFL